MVLKVHQTPEFASPDWLLLEHLCVSRMFLGFYYVAGVAVWHRTAPQSHLPMELPQLQPVQSEAFPDSKLKWLHEPGLPVDLQFPPIGDLIVLIHHSPLSQACLIFSNLDDAFVADFFDCHTEGLSAAFFMSSGRSPAGGACSGLGAQGTE